MVKKSRSVGRPSLTEEVVRERLATRGWDLIGQYDVANRRHTVRCLKCGIVVDKYINNIFYRADTCDCANPVKPGQIKQHLPGEVLTPPIPHVEHSTLEELLLQQEARLTAYIDKALADVKDSVIATAIAREDMIEKFSKSFTSTVSRRGYNLYDRAMDSVEWYKMGDTVARELLLLIEGEDSTTYRSYCYARRNNPTQKPEHAILSVIGKTTLFRALEKLQLVRLGATL